MYLGQALQCRVSRIIQLIAPLGGQLLIAMEFPNAMPRRRTLFISNARSYCCIIKFVAKGLALAAVFSNSATYRLLKRNDGHLYAGLLSHVLRDSG